MTKPRVLIVDDNRDFVDDISLLLEDDFECTGIHTAEGGLELLDQRNFDVLLLDIDLGAGMDGFGFLERIRDEQIRVPVVMITRDHSIDTVVRAIKMGAHSYVGKKPDMAELKLTLEAALREFTLQRDNEFLRGEVERLTGELLGESEAMKTVRSQIDKLSQIDSTVLITGETGTGKELVARAIHKQSARSGRPFVVVNSAAIPKELFESELFGHEKGAFTGALRRKIGKFELADKGTIFLDEIGDLEYSVQAKLLRVIQEKRFERVGANESISVDTRVLAATNKELSEKVRRGEFRDDLYFRLSESPIQIPPLRDRRQDILLLSREFIRRKSEELKKNVRAISQETSALLLSYDWPGNVRELENVLTNAIIYAESGILEKDLFPSLLTDFATFPDYEAAKQNAIDRFQREYIPAILKLTKGNVSEAARRMGISRQGLQKMLKSLGISPEESRPPQ